MGSDSDLDPVGWEGKMRGWREWMWMKYFIYLYENRIIKPVKIVWKGGEGERVVKGWIWSKYSICIYGSRRLKLHHIK
jgi:hypothetical protein